jgi:hypothetical protein
MKRRMRTCDPQRIESLAVLAAVVAAGLLFLLALQAAVGSLVVELDRALPEVSVQR